MNSPSSSNPCTSDTIATAFNSIIEIENTCSKESEDEALPEWIDCYVVTNIDPRCCGPLARELNALLPLRSISTHTSTVSDGSPSTHNGEFQLIDSTATFPKTDHLKRIRRRPATADEIADKMKEESEEEPNSKKVDVANQEIASNENPSASDPEPRCTPAKRKNDIEHSNNGLDETNEDKIISDGTAKTPHDKITANRPNTNKKEKRKKSSKASSAAWSLDLLIGSVEAVDDWLNSFPQSTDTNRKLDKAKIELSLTSILDKYNISPKSPQFKRRPLPGRPASTRVELDQWNQTLWPTLFFEKKTTQYKEEQKALTSDEVEMMILGMREALDDAVMGRRQWKEWNQGAQCNDTFVSNHKLNDEEFRTPFIAGAVVMDPLTGSTVSRASHEREKQGIAINQDENDSNSTIIGFSQHKKNGGVNNDDDLNLNSKSDTYHDDKKYEKTNQESHMISWTSFPDEANPLCTPALLAIQGVSRKERLTASGYGMESKEFRMGQVSTRNKIMSAFWTYFYSLSLIS